MKRKLSFLTIIWCFYLGAAQDYFPKNDGVKTEDHHYTAFINAKIYTAPGETLDNATLLIKKNTIEAVGANVSLPENCVVIDLKGKYIYPSFIDLYTDFGVAKPSEKRSRNNTVQYDATREGYYWNDHIMPEKKAIEKFSFNEKKAEEFLKAGFGVVNTHIHDGIIRGTSVLVALNTEADNGKRILDQNAAQHLSFKKSVTSPQRYPTSLMGAMALLRQFYHDAAWYEKGNANTKDLAIENVLKNRELPQIFDAGSKYNNLRADKIGDEFGINYIIKGGGDEFERITEIENTGARYIIPINFPKPYDVTDPYNASKVTLADMRFWNQAPSNPALLEERNIQFALTTDGLKKLNTFHTHLQKAIAYGLSKKQALAALTTIPAAFMGRENQLGKLAVGYNANFLIASGDIFEEKTILYENWVQGQKHQINDFSVKDIRGTYQLTVAGTSYELTINGKLSKPTVKVMQDSVKIESGITYNNGWVNLFFTPASDKEASFVRLSAPVTNIQKILGKGILTNGKEITWEAIRKEDAAEKNEKSDEEKAVAVPKVMPVTFPNKAFGFSQKPEKQNILFKNATVWTNENEGILKNADVWVVNGKIKAVGKDLEASDARIIDASGKHLTSGIIDEHSHIAAASINEAGHNSTAEVTIEDVVEPDDIDIYRNLSGGVTTIQILHGSANPIGGRSALIKLKWGENADEMLIDNALGFIKFALGENVKQSNWSSYNRFPQSRMGVEQVFIDYFQRAKEYNEKWDAYEALSTRQKARTKAPRYDEELHTIAEIINKERFISCHSYVQSEINMLMKVAEKFNFNVNTFTHILEGYKVADKMAAHGVAGSTFSDWWAYKYEVNDAIPYNAAIMHREGVLVAINSDDAEMSRRLNQEAAKAVKYGGVPEEEAWKFVTLNPAKMLHLDDRTGSIKTGKDADLVLWSDHPLSVYAVAEKTMIEGVIYYDSSQIDNQLARIEEERNTLVNMMIRAKNKGMKTRTPEKKEKRHLHCDSL
ncbi:amidohydrolase family protein [Ascidiimonas aurantiaca]|uniref:amidohydrolase family protein n=1 Tax=Ascidiimonas aurantiaca TaxID=1685432 RepID=UPI0030EE108D